MIKSFLPVAVLLISFTTRAQDVPAHAEKLMYAAYSQAKSENKNVIAIFHASWCGWCKKMDASMNDESVKKYFDDHYVTVHLTVDESANNKNLENPGAADFRSVFHGEQAGLPFFIVLDANGKLLADSYTRKPGQPLTEAGSNIGCPASAEEVETFKTILKNTSPLDETALNAIAARFRKNEVIRSKP